MGMFDHSKTWQFDVAAPPEACRKAFEDAVTKKPGFKLRAVSWGLRRESVSPQPGLPSTVASIATYQGRAGMAAGLTTVVGGRAQRTEEGAVGSELTFTVDESRSANGQTRCSLWLSSAGTTLGFTHDAGYFRSYMSDVENNLRQLDPSLTITKV